MGGGSAGVTEKRLLRTSADSGVEGLATESDSGGAGDAVAGAVASADATGVLANCSSTCCMIFDPQPPVARVPISAQSLTIAPLPFDGRQKSVAVANKSLPKTHSNARPTCPLQSSQSMHPAPR